MPYTFTITEVVNDIVVSTTNTNIAVTIDNINFTVTSTVQTFNLTQAYNTVTIYENAVELKLSNLNTFWRGNWATGTSYYNGDFVDYLYSTYLLKDVYLNSATPYNSNTTPDQDSNWQRIQWHEAPFDHLTVTNLATIGSASILGNLNSTNLTVSGGTVLTGARVNGVLTATSISSPSATITDLSVTNSLTAGNIGSNGTLTVNGGVRITGYTTITNTLKVDSITIGNSSETGALNIKGNANIDGVLTANTLTIGQRSDFNGPVYINDTLTFSAGSLLTVPNLTVSNQFITGGLRYPTYTGEYGQVLFTNGSTGTAWVNLGDLVFWDLSSDLLTNGFKILSGGANTDMVLGVGTSTNVTQRIKLTSTGTNIYGDLLPNNIKFPDGSNQTTAYLGVASVSQVGGIKKSSTDNSYSIDGSGVLTISTANIINSFIVPYAALGRTGGFKEGGSYYYVDDNTGYLVLDGTNLVKDNLPTATQSAYGAVKIGNGTDQYYVYLDGSGKARIPDLDYAGTNKWGIVKIGDYLNVTAEGIISVNTSSLNIAIQTPATTTDLGSVRIGSGISVTSTGTISVNTATTSRTGSVQVGNYLSIDSNAVLSVNTATLAPVLVAIGLTTATSSNLGGVKIGTNIIATGDGTINVPTASYSVTGAVRPNSNSFSLDVDGNLTLNIAADSTRGGIRTYASSDTFFQVEAVTGIARVSPNDLFTYLRANNQYFGTTTSTGIVQIGQYLNVNNGVVSVNTTTLYADLVLNTATSTVLGGIKVGTNLSSMGDGTLNVATGSTSTKGVVQVGNNINVNAGTISVATGSTSTLGLVKLGPGLSLDSNGAVIPDYSYTGTLRLSVQKVYIGTDVYHSTLYVERIESFDENGSVYFPGGVKFPDNTTQLTAYPGDFGVLGP